MPRSVSRPGGDPPEPIDPERLAGRATTTRLRRASPRSPTTDASTPDFQQSARAPEAAASGRPHRRLFREMLDKHPDSAHKATAEARSDDNAFLGCEIIHQSGPPERRIDVTVMGDGFTIDEPDQELQQDWAKLCLNVLWSEFVVRRVQGLLQLLLRAAGLPRGGRRSEPEPGGEDRRSRSATSRGRGSGRPSSRPRSTARRPARRGRSWPTGTSSTSG